MKKSIGKSIDRRFRVLAQSNMKKVHFQIFKLEKEKKNMSMSLFSQ